MDRFLDEGFAGGLIGISLRATVLLLVAWGVARGLRRSSAAVRHRVWSLAMLGLIALPMVARLGPAWEVPILPARLDLDLSDPESIPSADDPEVPAVETPRIEPAVIVEGRPEAEIRPSPALVRKAVSLPMSASDAILLIWATGAVLTFLPTLAGLIIGEVRRRGAGGLSMPPGTRCSTRFAKITASDAPLICDAARDRPCR